MEAESRGSSSSAYRAVLARFRELEAGHARLAEEMEELVRRRDVEEEEERKRVRFTSGWSRETCWNRVAGAQAVGAGPSQRVLQSMGFAVHVCRAFDGKIIFWNRTAESLYGWKEYEALGQRATDLIRDEQYHLSIGKFTESSMPNQSWSGQLPFKKRSGETFTALVTKSPLYEDGELVGVITVSADAAVLNIIDNGVLRTYEDPTHVESKEWKFNMKKIQWPPKTQAASVSQISSSVSNLASKVFSFRNGDDDACSSASSRNKEKEDYQDVDADIESSGASKLHFGKNNAEGNNPRKEESILGFVQPSKLAAKVKEKLNIRGGSNTSQEESRIISPCNSTGTPEGNTLKNGSNNSRDSNGRHLNLHNGLINGRYSDNDRKNSASASKDESEVKDQGFHGVLKKEFAETNKNPFVASWLERYGSPGEAEAKALHQKPQVSRSPTVSSPAESNSSHECLSSKGDKEQELIDECEIHWEDLHLGVEIGQGSYATVYHGNWNGSDVAIKVYSENAYHESTLVDYKKEVAIMRKLRHPNVLLFMGAVYSHERLAIVTEFLPRGSLFRTLHRNNQALDIRRRLRMALDIARGMNYLHRRNPPIVHRDLKSSNLLVDRNWTVKVGDFGLSKWKNATYLTAKSGRGTPQWMAPEVLRNEPSNEKSDVYSFGVILWELATESIPWSDLNSLQVVGVVGFMDRRLEVPESMDPKLSSMIHDCWNSNPESRPSFQELIQRTTELIKAFSARRGLPHEV